MVLPSGINKASGLQAALEMLGLSARTVIGVGDAENDHSFLEICGLPVAVAMRCQRSRRRRRWSLSTAREPG
jgi:hydroxymethylpyrimidine pyrophosphatase-like HAD family hydrolase